MRDEKLSFFQLLNFGSQDDEKHFVKFHKNTGDSSDWKCYYGVYGDNGFPEWTKRGKGKTIFQAADDAVKSTERIKG